MKSIVLLLLIFFPVHFYAQPVALRNNELNLQALFALQNKEKLQLNDSIRNLLEHTLKLEGAFEYPFDSLKYVGKILSDDEKVRILTWNIVLANGATEYFGFILHKSGNTIRLHNLCDADSNTGDPSTLVFDGNHWYGSLIYDIIDIKISGKTYYTVLAYDPADLFIKRKIVDVLWFRDELPVFGMPIFKYRNQLQNRIIFEYSAKVQMSLTYNKETDMIIFDHLAPTNQSLAGNYQYYVPDLSFDGLKFEKGIWEYIENIDARN